MNLVINLFFMVLLTGLTGTFMQILWYIGRKICVKGNPLFVYAGLRLVCFSYLLPVAYVLIIPYLRGSFYRVTGEEYTLSRMLGLTPHMKAVLEAASLVWFLQFLMVLFKRLAQIMKEKEFLSDCRREESPEVLARVGEYCQARVSLKREPEIYRSGDCASPMCMGLWSKKIILPEREYTKEELEIIFLHEMTHLKKRDLELKWLSVLITMVHCFNPMAFSLLDHLNAWSEIRCDICACRAGKDLFTADDYFDAILDMMKGRSPSRRISFVVTELLEKKSQIKKRIEYTRNYDKKSKSVKAASAVLMALILSLGLAGAYLIGSKGVRFYDTLIWKHFGQEEENGIENEEIILPDIENEWAFIDKTDSVDKAKSVVDMQWDIDGKAAYIIKKIYRKKREFIKINSKDIKPKGKELITGIIEPDGTGRYVKSLNFISYVFEITQSGYYSVFVKNPASFSRNIQFTYYILDENGE